MKLEASCLLPGLLRPFLNSPRNGIDSHESTATFDKMTFQLKLNTFDFLLLISISYTTLLIRITTLLLLRSSVTRLITSNLISTICLIHQMVDCQAYHFSKVRNICFLGIFCRRVFLLLLVCDVGQFCRNEGLMFSTLIHQGFGRRGRVGKK